MEKKGKHELSNKLNKFLPYFYVICSQGVVYESDFPKISQLLTRSKNTCAVVCLDLSPTLNLNSELYMQIFYNKLFVIRELLAENGTLYIKCPTNDVSNAVVLLNDVFGRNGPLDVLYKYEVENIPLSLMCYSKSA
jgi:hypothetical protein